MHFFRIINCLFILCLYTTLSAQTRYVLSTADTSLEDKDKQCIEVYLPNVEKANG